MRAYLKRVLSMSLVVSMLTLSLPVQAMADIRQLPVPWGVSPTNPGAIDQMDGVWREGWGNNPAPEFQLNSPTPDPGQPIVLGAFYYLTRPHSTPGTLTVDQWADSSMAWFRPDVPVWKLRLDVPTEVRFPGAYFDSSWVPPVAPSVPYEGPFSVFVNYFSQQRTDDTTNAAGGSFRFGLDVTPPQQVPSLTATPLAGAMTPDGWLTQSRIRLSWPDIKYDSMSGVGYFEVFLNGRPYPVALYDGTPYPVPVDDAIGRRVFDLKEHYYSDVDWTYWGYRPVPTPRSMVIEDLPPGEHTLQVRAVDRATNAGALSPPVTVKVDPDIPIVKITSPAVNGGTLGARPTFSADATDRAGIREVGFYVTTGMTTSLVGTVTAAPYSIRSSVAYSHNSTHTLTAVAVDMAGRTKTDTRLFVVDNRPTVTAVTPSIPGQAFSRLVPLAAKATDQSGLSTVTIAVAGQPTDVFPISGSPTSTQVVTQRFLPVGTYTVTMTAHNVTGGSASVTTSLSVDGTQRPQLPSFAPADSTGAPGTVSRWFNTGYPTFSESADTGLPDPVEMLYRVDRSPMTVINPATPWLYDTSYRLDPASTHLNGVIDQHAVVLADPLSSGALQMPGVITDSLEGVWYTHAMMRDGAGNASKTLRSVYGIDRTTPTTVTAVNVFSNATTTTPMSGWTDQTRAVIKWDPSERDALSGTDHYEVVLKHATGDVTVPQRIAFQPGRTGQMALTIEDLVPGLHTVHVRAVDKAGNKGPASTPAFIRIRSTPRITISSPASAGTTLTSPAPLRATVLDDAGIDRVVFSIEGTTVARTFTPASSDATSLVSSMYAILPTGTYTLNVTAYSVSGPTAVVRRSFNVDASLPPEIEPPPGGGTGPVVTPAFTWFNTVFPTFIAKPSATPTDPVEMLYLVDRTPVTLIDSLDPNSYYASFAIKDLKTHVNGVIDQQGVWLSDPVAFDGETLFPGRVTSPLEGVWYIHALVRNALGASGGTTHVGYGVDLTPPLAVTGVTAFRSITSTIPLTTWVAQNRVVIKWNSTERDRLSGTEFFKVYVDGNPFDGEKGLIAFQPGRSTMSVTIEDLPSGVHAIQVTAIDRAGNEGPVSATTTVRIDGESPKVRILTPTSGARVGITPLFSALTSDSAGVASVTFLVDGVSVGTVAPASPAKEFKAQVTPNLSSFSAGNRVLTVMVTDVVGNVAVASRSFVLDKTVPVLTVTSAGPTPFYPRLRDGYRDNFVVRFSASEDVTARLVIKNSSGTTVRTLTKTVAEGSGSITWNGKNNAGVVRAGTYRWYLQLTDVAGNKSSTRTGTTEIRTFEVIRLSSGSVRIVQR